MPPAPTVPAPWPACRRGVPLGGWVANGRGPVRFPLLPVGEAPKRRPFLHRFHREPKPKAVPAGTGTSRSRRRSHSTAPLGANPRRTRSAVSKSGGDSPFPYAAFGSSETLPKTRPFPPRMVSLDVVPASAFAAARPASRVPFRFRFPSRFPAPHGERNRFGSACRLFGVSLRFLRVAPSRLQE